MSVTKAPPKKKVAASSEKEGEDLVRADRLELEKAGRDAPTNVLDEAVVNSTLALDVIKDAYDTYTSFTGDRALALKEYFKPGGPAETDNHDKGVAMSNYLAQRLEPRIIKDAAHPVYGGIGVFARVAIPAWTVLGIYGGLVTSSARAITDHGKGTNCLRSSVDARRTCDHYIWVAALRNAGSPQQQPARIRDEFKKLAYKGYRRNITKATDLEVLGLHHGNMLRFVNTYHNIVDEDYRNVEVATVWWRGLPRIVYMTRRAVDKGDELLVDYGRRYNVDDIVAEAKSAKADDASSQELEDPEINELVVTSITGHRPKTNPLKFRVVWNNGGTTWEHARNLVELDESDPRDPYIFNAKFLEYLRANGIPPRNYRRKELYTPGPFPPEADTSDIDDDDDDEDEETETGVTSVDAMKYSAKRGEYFFHVRWSDGTESWEPPENFVDEYGDGAGRKRVFNAEFVKFLRGKNIPDPVVILERKVVPVRIISHRYGASMSRQEKPSVMLFETEMSSGATVDDLSFELLATVSYGPGGPVVKHSPVLRQYMEVLRQTDDRQSLDFIQNMTAKLREKASKK